MNYIKLMKVFAFAGIALACFGGVTYVVNTNRMLQSHVRDVLRKNSVLTSRIKREVVNWNRVARLNADRMKEEELRAKRSAAERENDEENVVTSLQGKGGVTYERWGRRDCSGPNNELVFHGISAGAWYAHTGGASNHLCMDMNVTYTPGRYTEGSQANSFIHGMEYRDTDWVTRLLDLSLTEGVLRYHLVPCAICMARSRFTNLMIPGRETCPDGWSLEYTGYIMSGGHNDKHSSNAICVDDTPQVVPGTQGNQNGAYLHMVEVKCNSLLCEPFVDNRELRCVVCTI